MGLFLHDPVSAPAHGHEHRCFRAGARRLRISRPVDPGCSTERSNADAHHRATAIRQALRLEYLTVGWNVIEGAIAITAAVLANSVALLGFGIDSCVESASGIIMLWRLRAEQIGATSEARIEAIEHRARRLVAVSLFLLAAYVTVDSVATLRSGDQPSFSAVGVALAAVSIVVMIWLARAKRTVAKALGSRAMEADAAQTTACWWLSVATLLGVGLNGAFGWWWADPVAALAIVLLILQEAWKAWRGEECCA
jgi:cation diffusion facilitator family transporter